MVRDFISGDAPRILGEIDDDLHKDEVEIARIVLNSTLGDVTSIRARRTRAGTVLVRMVDEHESVYSSVHVRARRHTLGQLVEFIDNAKMHGERESTLPYVEACVEYGAEGDIAFMSLESDVYPELGLYYASRLVARDKSKRGDDEEVEDDA